MRRGDSPLKSELALRPRGSPKIRGGSIVMATEKQKGPIPPRPSGGACDRKTLTACNIFLTLVRCQGVKFITGKTKGKAASISRVLCSNHTIFGQWRHPARHCNASAQICQFARVCFLIQCETFLTTYFKGNMVFAKIPMRIILIDRKATYLIFIRIWTKFSINDTEC